MRDLYDSWIYTLYPDKETKWQPERALQLMRTLLAHFNRVGLCITAMDWGIVPQIIDLSEAGEPVSSEFFRAVYPEIGVRGDRIHPLLQGENTKFPIFYMLLPLKSANTADHPMLYVDDIQEDADPLSAVFQAMKQLRTGEQVNLCTFIHRLHKPVLHQGIAFVSVFNKYRRQDPKKYQRRPTEFERMLEDKREGIWYECHLAIEIYAASIERVAELAQAITAQLPNFARLFPNQPHNGPIAHNDMIRVAQFDDLQTAGNESFHSLYSLSFEDKVVQKEFEKLRTYLDPRELAVLWHLPHRGFRASNVAWKPNLPETTEGLSQNTEGVLLGHSVYQGDATLVHLPEQTRMTHMNIVGRTGVGKSTFMHNLIRGDIEAGHGVCVIDPHGALVRDILQCSIPQTRVQDVLVLDLADETYPIPLNIFAGKQSYTSVGRVVDVIEHLYSTGVRMDRFLRAGIETIQYYPQATMHDLARFLSNKPFRDHVLEQVSQPDLRDFWDEEYPDKAPAQQRQIREPIIHRISPFYSNPYLYPSLCHPRRLSFDELIAERKIVLISLGISGELVPERERNLVGALLISLLQMVGMNPRRKVVPFFVYVDEVQNFVTTSLATVFNESRKYELAWTVANQFFGQLSNETLLSIMSNVSTTVAFRSNAPDAQALRPYMHPQFDVETLVNLDMYQAAVKTQVQGKTQKAFWLHTSPPPQRPDDAVEREDSLRATAARNYDLETRDEVLNWLKQHYVEGQQITRTTNDKLVDENNDYDPNPPPT